jgi:hypothetical protein
MAGFCEHGNEHSNCIGRGDEFLNYMSDYKLIKRDYATHTYFVSLLVIF